MKLEKKCVACTKRDCDVVLSNVINGYELEGLRNAHRLLGRDFPEVKSLVESGYYCENGLNFGEKSYCTNQQRVLMREKELSFLISMQKTVVPNSSVGYVPLKDVLEDIAVQ